MSNERDYNVKPINAGSSAADMFKKKKTSATEMKEEPQLQTPNFLEAASEKGKKLDERLSKKEAGRPKLSDEEKNTERVTIYLTPAEFKKLSTIGQKHYQSPAKMLRILVGDMLGKLD